MVAARQAPGVDLLASLREPFVRRVTTGRAWAWFAFEAPRLWLAIGIALAPALVLGILFLGAPGLRSTLVDPERVPTFFGRIIPGLITAATLAVALSSLTMQRSLKGLGELREHASEDERYRERAGRALGRKELPLGVPALVAAALDEVAARARAARATEGPQDPDELLEILEARASSCARKVLAKRADADAALAAALDFEHEAAAHLLRRALRDPTLAGTRRGSLEGVLEAVETMALARSYLRTLATQRGLARMVQAIVVSAFLGIVVLAFLALGYPADAPARWGDAAALLVALGLTAIATPLAVFVSYALRFVFVHEHTLPLGEFVLGPENRAVAGDAGPAREEPRRGEPARR